MKYYLGIDLGGMSAKCAVLKDGALCGVCRCKTDKSFAPEQTAADLSLLAEEAINLSGIAKEQIGGIGIGSPGIIDSDNGIVVSWSNFGWEKVELARLVGEKTGLPVYVLNDANAATYGECAYGSAKKYRSAVMLTIGTGVGGGIVFDGKLLEGNGGAGAELGHEVIRFGGEKCSCGRRGCLEAYASATALIRQTKKAMALHTDSLLWQLCNQDIDAVNGKIIFEAFHSGDKTAKAVINKYLGYLSEGVINYVNIFRPEAVIIGGGISAQGEFITKPVQRKVNRFKLGGKNSPAVKIVAAKLGNDAGIFGAAAFAESKNRTE
ncbi:MAG: ROK family protein [Candidatus Coproplasma sp.]